MLFSDPLKPEQELVSCHLPDSRVDYCPQFPYTHFRLVKTQYLPCEL